MVEKYNHIRIHFEKRMGEGVRIFIYDLTRLAGGEYISPFTEIAWKEYLAGWLAAVEEFC
jgi:hypothetical protein